MNTLERILDLARWAPSGDNMQTWRFEIVSERRLVVHGWDTRDHCVYDLEGHASQIALGGLLELTRIAASVYGLSVQVEQRIGTPENRPTFDLEFLPDERIAVDPLADFIRVRAVQRRPMHTRALTNAEKSAMAAALGDTHEVIWIESLRARLKFAKVLFDSAKIRLTIPEAYATHASIIEWGAQFSESRIPDQAVGLDPITTRLSQWALESWSRVDFMNRYCAGTVLPRLQLDLLCGVACAAHFMLLANRRPAGIEDYLLAGRAWLRFWLTATRLGLWQQPEMTPLIFSGYSRHGIQFTKDESALQMAKRVQLRLNELFTADIVERAVVQGRVGAGPPPTARSLRLPLNELMATDFQVSSSRR